MGKATALQVSERKQAQGRRPAARARKAVCGRWAGREGREVAEEGRRRGCTNWGERRPQPGVSPHQTPGQRGPHSWQATWTPRTEDLTPGGPRLDSGTESEASSACGKDLGPGLRRHLCPQQEAAWTGTEDLARQARGEPGDRSGGPLTPWRPWTGQKGTSGLAGRQDPGQRGPSLQQAITEPGTERGTSLMASCTLDPGRR